MANLIHPPPVKKKGLTMKNLALLLSKASSPQQVAHYNFDPSPEPLYSGILSFSDSTTLTIPKDKDFKHVRVPRVFVIVFSASCCHCGSPYVEENRRLFFKLMPSRFM